MNNIWEWLDAEVNSEVLKKHLNTMKNNYFDLDCIKQRVETVEYLINGRVHCENMLSMLKKVIEKNIYIELDDEQKFIIVACVLVKSAIELSINKDVRQRDFTSDLLNINYRLETLTDINEILKEKGYDDVSIALIVGANEQFLRLIDFEIGDQIINKIYTIVSSLLDYLNLKTKSLELIPPNNQLQDIVVDIELIKVNNLIKLLEQLDITKARLIDIKASSINHTIDSSIDYFDFFEEILFENNKIVLKVDDEFLKTDDVKNVVNKILNVKNNIEGYLTKIYKDCGEKKQEYLWGFEGVQIDSENPIFLKLNPMVDEEIKKPEVEQEKDEVNQQQEVKEQEEIEEQEEAQKQEETKEQEVDIEITVIKPNHSKKIEYYIAENELLLSGHFILSERRVARDWIDVKKIIDNEDWKNRIVTDMSNHISKNSENILVIGIDFVGLVLGSLISLQSQICDFTYLLSEKQQIDFDSHEVALPKNICDKLCQNYNKIVFVVDAIVTGQSINAIIKKIVDDYDIEKSKISIYAVFYREALECDCKKNINKIEFPLYVINNSIPIEICSRNDEMCIYRKNNISGVYYNIRR